MKKLSIGIQTFSKLVKEDYIYVDKTKIIHQLITRGSFYFLSRPRRFGKSLLVSTLAEIFRGNRDLFTGLAIDLLPYDWEKYPVVMISFAGISYTTTENLENGIKLHLQHISKEYDITISDEKLNPGQLLQALIIQLSKQGNVALLIDEYDYAILQHIHHQKVADTMRETLKNFYAVIKDLDPYLKFVFLTGVSKFPKTSIFSGLNNLNDISLDVRYNELLGYTQPEITTYFQDYLIDIAKHNNNSMDELLKEITKWYNGYQFCEAQNATKIYNPFSVLLFLSQERFSNYWFESGTPTFLINLLKQHNYPMQEFESIEATESELGMFETQHIPLKTLLFQTGYLTIHGYNATTKNYILGYPNKETAESYSFLIHRIASIKNVSDVEYKYKQI